MSIDQPRITINRTAGFIAGGMIALLGFAIGSLVFVSVPSANQNALLVLIGALTTNVTAVVAFYFGSSSSDKSKNDTIQQQQQTISKAQDAMTPAPDVMLPQGDTVTVKAEKK